MTDPRFEAARSTDQSGGRGWDFSPSREPTRSGWAIAFIGLMVAVCTVLSLVDQFLSGVR